MKWVLLANSSHHDYRNREDLQETKTIMKTLDPEWNQTLIFLNLPRDELIRQKLKLTLWDYDRFKSDDFMGELALHLSGL